MPNVWDYYKVIKKFIQNNQPIGLTGALIHPYYWLMSKAEDYIRKPINADSTEKRTGIYVIPGTADFPFSLLRMVERLINKGKLSHINSFTIVSFFKRFQGKSIDDFSQELLDKIIANNEESIILIGHSRGGLIAAKTAIEVAKMGVEVKAVVTIATPFNGSHLALPPLTWLSASVKQMAVGNIFLKNLAEQVLKSKIPHYFMIAGNDEIVRKGAFIKEYVENHPKSMFIFPRHGHLSLVSSHNLVNRIYNIIAAEELSKTKELTYKDDHDQACLSLENDKNAEKFLATITTEECVLTSCP